MGTGEQIKGAKCEIVKNNKVISSGFTPFTIDLNSRKDLYLPLSYAPLLYLSDLARASLEDFDPVSACRSVGRSGSQRTSARSYFHG